MKLTAYNYRADELDLFRKYAEKYGAELSLCADPPGPDNAEQAKGSDCISMITTPMGKELMERFFEAGVRFISTRSIGYEHIDLKAAKALGMHVGNVSYDPAGVADYTVMLMLMATRRLKAISLRAAAQDFTIQGVQGRELHNLTAGVIGTGRIGRTVIRRLAAFGGRLLAYDLFRNDETKRYAEYVPLERLFAESDVITMHMPATKDNYHLINRDSIAKMKDGVFLVNTARGSLIDTDALIEAVESKKVAGAALDVVENETGLYYNNLKNEVIGNRELAVLKSFPNVIVTPHTAFYTDQAVSDMVEHSIESCALFAAGKQNPWQLV